MPSELFHASRPHPWHGLRPHLVGPLVDAYIELTPFDLVKYELDKDTGYLRVDRPQRTSSMPPTLYGFIPRTLCSARVSALSKGAKDGDNDPLDICVISERPIARSEVIMRARVIGGIKLIDDGEVDDKIIAVFERDEFWQDAKELSDMPQTMVDRLTHYFRTYKAVDVSLARQVIEGTYGVKEALEVIQAALDDYDDAFDVQLPPPPASRLGTLPRL